MRAGRCLNFSARARLAGLRPGAYLEQMRRIAPLELLGRDEEFAKLVRFCLMREPTRTFRGSTSGLTAGSTRRRTRRVLLGLGLVATGRLEIALLIHGNTGGPSEPAFCLCPTPQPASLTRLVKAARTRWAVRERFQTPK
jgi:hypothetical protein